MDITEEVEMATDKIGDIKEQLKNTPDTELRTFIEAHATDDRSGVIKLVESAQKRLDKYISQMNIQ